MNRFRDRYQAGRMLAELLKDSTNHSHTMVLALPRGGVPVGYEMAKALLLPLDVLIVRKLGVPDHKELAMGAVTATTQFLNKDIIAELAIKKSAIKRVLKTEREELERRELIYRAHRKPLVLKNRHIILVDDGIATGATMQVAINAIKEQKPRELIIAVPVAALETYEEMRFKVDKIVCLLTPAVFYSVGAFYDNFEQTTDGEVKKLLHDSLLNVDAVPSSD